jgi:hypothetical protein
MGLIMLHCLSMVVVIRCSVAAPEIRPRAEGLFGFALANNMTTVLQFDALTGGAYCYFEAGLELGPLVVRSAFSTAAVRRAETVKADICRHLLVPAPLR